MLVRPFIQPINAFDVSQNNGVAIVSVLGGDIIQKINYEIYSGSSLVYNSSITVSDNGGDTIRDFTISLSSSMGLANNNAYTLRAYTERTVDGTTEYSGYSSVQYFSCYVTPTITIKDESDNTVSSGYVFTSQSGTLMAVFNAVSASSPAILNDIEINIFGINGTTRDLVYSSGAIYTPFIIEFDNLTPTTIQNPLYTTYTLEWTAHTVQNMPLSGAYTSMTCDYTITQSTGLINVSNIGEKGCVKVNIFPNLINYRTSEISSMTNGILSMCHDEKKIYVGGAAGQFAIYDKENGQFGSLIENQLSTGLYSMATDTESVYVGSTGTFAIYSKQEETFGDILYPFGNEYSWLIESICVDDNNVYIVADRYFVVYNKQTGAFGIVSSPVDSGWTLAQMVDDENNVYISSRKHNDSRLVVYNKSAGTFSTIETPFSGVSPIDAMCMDNGNICMTSGNQFVFYDVKNNYFSSQRNIPISPILSIASDSSNLYFSTTDEFVIYRKILDDFSDILDAGGFLTVDYNNLYLGKYTDGVSSNGIMYTYHSSAVTLKRKDTTNNSTTITLETLNEGNVPIVGYYFYDYYTKTNAIYEYQITIGNQVETVEVLSQFCGAYIADGEQAFEIDAEWERGSFSQVQQSAIYEPYGAKYPVIAYNAVTNYRKGTDSCIVFNQPYAYNRSNDYIDRINQTKKQKAVNEFLTNRKPKVIKDFNGDIALVSIVDVVGNSFVKELGNTLATTQFNWVEVGDFDDDTFRKLGITNSFKLYKN